MDSTCQRVCVALPEPERRQLSVSAVAPCRDVPFTKDRNAADAKTLTESKRSRRCVHARGTRVCVRACLRLFMFMFMFMFMFIMRAPCAK